MEIIRGSLDDISRPASSEQTGSRVSSVSLLHIDRSCPPSPSSLVVLTNDAVDTQMQSSSDEATGNSSAKGQCHIDVAEEDQSKLQQATEEMKRLDEILSAQICKEKEARRKRKELQAKLWREFLENKPEGHYECAQEASNTRLFLALETSIGTEEEDYFVPVFETQAPEWDYDEDNQRLEQSEKSSDSLTESSEVISEDSGEDQFEGSYCGASKGKNKQKNFVKRNTELVSGEEGQMILTQAERERLAELLREIDEEEEDSARGADGEEAMWAVSVLTGQGYTPGLPDLQQLIDIDSRIRLFLPDEDFRSIQTSCTTLSMFEAPGSGVGWKCTGDPPPGEKVLQDTKERRGQERRLREIQQQLEILGLGQEMTNESPDLTEEQLRSLLDECELTESWSQDLEMTDTTP